MGFGHVSSYSSKGIYSDLSPEPQKYDGESFPHNNKFNNCILVRCLSTENALETFDCMRGIFGESSYGFPQSPTLPAHMTSIQPSAGWER